MKVVIYRCDADKCTYSALYRVRYDKEQTPIDLCPSHLEWSVELSLISGDASGTLRVSRLPPYTSTTGPAT